VTTKMSTNKTVNATSRQQLVDLNEDTTNFDLTFTASATNGSDFDVLVVDQATLDSNPALEFKRTSGGSISGNIVSDKDTYQNYFLCIKADHPTEVNIAINKREIPPNPSHQMHHQQAHHQQPDQQAHHQQPNQQAQRMQQMQRQQDRLLPQQAPQQSNNGMNTKKLIYIAIAVLGGGFLLYYFYTKMNTKKEKGVGEVAKSTTTLSPVVAELPPTSSSPTTGLPQIPSTPVKGFGFGTGVGSTFGGGIASRMANLSIPKRT